MAALTGNGFLAGFETDYTGVGLEIFLGFHFWEEVGGYSYGLSIGFLTIMKIEWIL